MREIDLHIHTTGSDGTCPPREAVKLARDRGLKAMAVTDHDTVIGYPEAAAAGEELGIEVVPGIEISTKYGVAVHVLGYYIDPASPALRPVLDWVVADRDSRNRKMAELMAADGLPVTYEGMQERFGEVIGRPHFARVLVELGLAMSGLATKVPLPRCCTSRPSSTSTRMPFCTVPRERPSISISSCSEGMRSSTPHSLA